MAESPAIKALEDEIAAVEKAQQPTREQIAKLEADLVEGQQIIARNRAALDVLNGNVAIASGAPRRRRSSGSSPAITDATERRIIDYIGANAPVGASAIAKEVLSEDKTPQALTTWLGEQVEAGKIKREGERRGTKYKL